MFSFFAARPHSVATGGGGGYPSDRGSAASLALAAGERTVSGSNNGYDILGDNSSPSLQSVVSKKKKRGACAVSPDKKGRGLRQFSIRVCEKVQSKGITTYNETRRDAPVEVEMVDDSQSMYLDFSSTHLSSMTTTL